MTDRPSAQQIAATVRACAVLDPIAWAAERKRIKAICGEDYRLTDLDRMYKQGQKEVRKTNYSSGALANDRYFVEDGSFLRIRNIQLGYTLPEPISRKIRARKIRFYVAVNNLATFTKYRGYDPDFNSGSSLTGGVDQGFYPKREQ